MKVKIISVDTNACQGRKYHPEQSHVGLVCTIVQTNLCSLVDGCDFDFDGTTGKRLLANLEDGVSTVYSVVTPSGEKLELMDFEVEVSND